MNRRAIVKYIAVVLAAINLIWMLGFNYRIPGRSAKSNTPEYTVAETSEASKKDSEKKDQETVETEAADNSSMDGNEDMEAAKHKKCRVVQATGLNVRSGPGPDYYIVTTVRGGTEMECLDDGEGAWIHVRTPDGKEGYVSKKYVEMVED